LYHLPGHFVVFKASIRNPYGSDDFPAFALPESYTSNVPTMAVGAAVQCGSQVVYSHFVDPRRKWYNNRRLIIWLKHKIDIILIVIQCPRLIALNGWITLLYVVNFSFSN